MNDITKSFIYNERILSPTNYIIVVLINKVIQPIYKFSVVLSRLITGEQVTFIQSFQYYIRDREIVYLSRYNDVLESKLEESEEDEEEIKDKLDKLEQSIIKYYHIGICTVSSLLIASTFISFSLNMIHNTYLSIFSIIFGILLSAIVFIVIHNSKYSIVDYNKEPKFEVVND